MIIFPPAPLSFTHLPTTTTFPLSVNFPFSLLAVSSFPFLQTLFPHSLSPRPFLSLCLFLDFNFSPTLSPNFVFCFLCHSRIFFSLCPSLSNFFLSISFSFSPSWLYHYAHPPFCFICSLSVCVCLSVCMSVCLSLSPSSSSSFSSCHCDVFAVFITELCITLSMLCVTKYVLSFIGHKGGIWCLVTLPAPPGGGKGCAEVKSQETLPLCSSCSLCWRRGQPCFSVVCGVVLLFCCFLPGWLVGCFQLVLLLQ